MKISFKNKLLLTFIFFGTLLTSVSIFAIYTINSENIKENSIKKAQEKALEKIDNFHNYSENIQDKLKAIQYSKVFQKYLRLKQNYGATRELFLNIAYTSKDIMQLRYINNSGKEIIRIDRKNRNSNPTHVAPSKLQNKAQRYYFKKIMKSKKETIWSSQIDLNVENGEIQKPFQSVLRVGTPIFTNGKRDGLLIINVFMNEFLKKFSESPTYNIYMIDNNGYFKAHQDKNKMWSNYKNSSHNIKDILPDEYKKILKEKEHFCKKVFSKNIGKNGEYNTKIVVQAKQYRVRKEINAHINDLLLVMLGIILLSFPFAREWLAPAGQFRKSLDCFRAGCNCMYVACHRHSLIISLYCSRDAV